MVEPRDRTLSLITRELLERCVPTKLVAILCKSAEEGMLHDVA